MASPPHFFARVLQQRQLPQARSCALNRCGRPTFLSSHKRLLARVRNKRCHTRAARKNLM
jgi:hypothetical protein